MSELLKKKSTNEPLGITYEIVRPQYDGGEEYLEVIFKGKQTVFDPNIDYGAVYLGKPLWNGSLFLFVDARGCYTWDQVDKRWYPQIN